MNDTEFFKGWAILTAQRYAQWLMKDNEMGKYEVQERLWKHEFLLRSAEAWSAAITWWVTHETKWPEIPQMIEQCNRFQKKFGPQLRLISQSEYRGGIPPDDWFFNRAFSRWTENNCEGKSLRELLIEEVNLETLSREDKIFYNKYLSSASNKFGMKRPKNYRATEGQG